ncbi:hypothetical protein PUMCH_000537 [Australozyma saopauloensis]|uniref:C2H2-type domain-containing protein n=1 Tax=Australozyma saopauloensis TaxID=291208 RepID=A0AAX4H4D8_9ASCO|nr:hypothetical protein PUMCH_000537 [[Candida] saopauloensis]
MDSYDLKSFPGNKLEELFNQSAPRQNEFEIPAMTYSADLCTNIWPTDDMVDGQYIPFMTMFPDTDSPLEESTGESFGRPDSSPPPEQQVVRYEPDVASNDDLESEINQQEDSLCEGESRDVATEIYGPESSNCPELPPKTVRAKRILDMATLIAPGPDSESELSSSSYQNGLSVFSYGEVSEVKTSFGEETENVPLEGKNQILFFSSDPVSENSGHENYTNSSDVAEVDKNALNDTTCAGGKHRAHDERTKQLSARKYTKQVWDSYDLQLDRECRFMNANDLGYPCPRCGKVFVRNDNRRRHFRSAHAMVRPYKCPQCGRDFSRSDNLAMHLRSHAMRGRVERSKIPQSIHQQTWFYASSDLF